jgi:hypothetical protein
MSKNYFELKAELARLDNNFDNETNQAARSDILDAMNDVKELIKNYDISDDDLFECTRCRTIADIEDSNEFKKELFCEKCKPINLNTLSNFELNKLFIQSYCMHQTIKYHDQRMTCDIIEISDDTCYFRTESGKEQNFSYMSDAYVHIGKYKLNIQHNKDTITVTSSEHPDIEAISVPMYDRHEKAICYMVIRIFDKYRKKYYVEALEK